MRLIFIAACLGFLIAGSGPASASTESVVMPARVPELELAEALPIALQEMQRQGLEEVYIIRAARFLAGKERGWEFTLTHRRAGSKSEPSIWVSTDKKVVFRAGR